MQERQGWSVKPIAELFTRLALLAAISARAVPAQVLELPPPTGPASIGFRSFHWIDSSRAEPMTKRLDDRREVAAFLWYPATATQRSRALYVPDSSILPSGYRQRFPTVVSLHQHGFANAPIDARATPLPVLLFSPGGGMSATSYVTIIEDLVSHGFVVLGVDASYDGFPVRLSDGRVATSSELVFADGVTQSRNRVDARALDLLFALRQLERLNAGSPVSDIRGRLDLTRVGVFGHSRGGLAAAEACKREPRLRGCLNYDGNFLNGGAYADTVAGVLSQPFMMFRRFRPEPTDSMLKEWKMSAHDWTTNRDTLEKRARRVIRNAVASSYLVTIDGATHLSFSDAPLLWTAAPVAAAERARSQEDLLKAIREYTRAFFDFSVRGAESRLLSGATPTIPYGTTPPFIQLEILPPLSQ
ncbi:MAG: alpha/beta hydrolase family protein [Gemmatimonadaceae bacterium]